MNSGTRFFAISLWDYGLPDCCSGVSYYYGTIDEIEDFIALLSQKEKQGFEETILAFEKYKLGNTTVTHNVAYCQTRLITPVKLLSEKQIQLSATAWTYFNAYDAPYYLKCDEGTCSQIVLMRGDKYYRCLRCHLKNLYYSTELEKPMWKQLNGAFWGHPCIIESQAREKTEYILKNTLFVEEKQYDGAEQATSDASQPDLSAFARDVFGDG